MINITFPDGAVRQYEPGITALDIAKSISEGLARKVLAAKVNGQVIDATRPITTDATLQLLTWTDTDGKATMWHSSAHLMAEALEALYPGVKFGIGPAIENGFYYDVDLGGQAISEEDLKKLEAKMAELAKQNNTYQRKEVSKAEALQYFTGKDDQYKLELINDLQDGTITFYTQGGFTDLCRGPHIPSTGFIKAVKLTSIAGAYWRGKREKIKMLTRIYGITFPTQKELDEYLALVEEAKKRDHRKLGKELELFTFSERVGLGLAFMVAQRRAAAGAPATVPAESPDRERLPARGNPAYRQQKPVYHLRALREIRKGQFSTHPYAGRRRGVHAQTHELPPSLRNLPFIAQVL